MSRTPTKFYGALTVKSLAKRATLPRLAYLSYWMANTRLL
jgi:hypothetical protein